MEAHVAEAGHQTSQLLCLISPVEHPGYVGVRAQVPYGCLMQAGLGHHFFALEAIHDVPVEGHAERER